MSKYQVYSEYQEVNSDWIGKVPKSWTTTPVKMVSDIFNGATPKSGESSYWDGEVSWVTPADLGKRQSPFISFGQRSITRAGYESCGTTIVPANSIILSSRAPIGTLGISEKDMCTNQGCKSLVVKNSLNYKFLYYALRISTAQLNLLGRGTTFLELSADELGSYKIPKPSVYEQQQIANFLDHETAKIDTLIEKQQQLIKLLKEKRQAVISHAVTKGLNADVPMKDSGVEWLGEVPEHWIVTKLKWKASTTSGGTPTSSAYNIYYSDGSIPWIRTTDLNNDVLNETPVSITEKALDDTACSILPENTVLVAMYGGAGSIGKHSLLKFPDTINQAVCGILPCSSLNPEYLHLFVEYYRPYWMVNAEGTRKDPNIGQDHIREVLVTQPPIEEQSKIAAHISKYKSKSENLIKKSENAIEFMIERRTALISAAVTGKIDVRNWKPEQSQPSMEASA